MKKLIPILAGTLALCAVSARAVPELYIHDAAGQLAKVDVPTGTVTAIGSMGLQMTDIAFDPTGVLYGMSFTGLYTINPLTAAITFIGNHGVAGGNALVFGADGTLYAAGSSGALFTLNTGTGASSFVGNMGFASAGDLAFNGGDLYLASNTHQLVKVDVGTGAGAAIGSFGYSSVFGLATADNGVLYGVSGTTIFSVNTTTGAGTFVSNYGAQGLGASYGSSFYTEAGASVPDSGSTLGLMAGAVAVLGLLARRK
jgi:hypothetical protein